MGRPKQYKDRFKVWGWQKNLPADTAHFIVKKSNDRKRANPSKNTIFHFGGKEWTAERGGGARLNGEELGEILPKEEIEILSFEATLTSSVAEKAAAMVGVAYRLRIMGSLALSLCHLAAGRVDAVCSLKAARAVDIAAAQLLVRERGLAIDLPEAAPFGEAPLDTEGRSRVVAAATTEVCAELFAALSR